MSEELKKPYELKEAYCEWFDWAKTIKNVAEVKRRFGTFYRKVEDSNIPVFLMGINNKKSEEAPIVVGASITLNKDSIEH